MVDEKAKSATLTPRGIKKAEEYFQIENLNDAEHITIQHHINQAIKANSIMQKDIDYVVKQGESSSWMSSPAASCTDADTTEAFTKRLKPKGRDRGSEKKKLWLPSPSRTSSVSTKSCPA